MTSIDVNFSEQAKVSPIPVNTGGECLEAPAWKRALDVSFVLMLLPFLLLVGIPIALWIKLV
ncbi:MAG TPA: hypothetical protein VHB20_15380, partial [Verrucomicrobiae bacterium]|nr:hypothetical protein [Verrucomicrobiae bacterium]